MNESTDALDEELLALVHELLGLPAETTWVEFKRNNSNPQDIGEYISAVSNAAALVGKEFGYLLWGIDDATHQVVGSSFRPNDTKQGGEDLQNWLLRQLEPGLYFKFFELEFGGHPVVLLEIPRAAGTPTRFRGIEYVRVGSYRQKLAAFPELERKLWRGFDEKPFERLTAASRRSGDQVLMLLDYAKYFELLKQPPPTDREAILTQLANDQMIRAAGPTRWDITNLGAILFAKNLDSFPSLGRKPMRVIVYSGRGKHKTMREQVGAKGYAAGFEGLIDYIDALIPRNEVVRVALREEVPMYPEIAVRELVANALIHQDFSISGAGPMIEIFEDRMEITNPGTPLVSTDRFLDLPPRSRNEALASFMRRAGVCEERGSGIDKVVHECEFYQLPAPAFETTANSTRATLFAHKKFRSMGRHERVSACYLHACLRRVQNDAMTNSTLRERFGIAEHNSAIASRIIRDAIDDGLVKPYEPNQARRFARYLPFWA